MYTLLSICFVPVYIWEKKICLITKIGKSLTDKKLSMIAFNPFLTVCWNSNLLVQMLWNLSNDDTVNCCWTVFLVSRQRVLTLPRYISYCKFIYMLALFLLQMSTCVGLVSAANVYMCWSGSFCKCLYVLLLFLLQISIHVGLHMFVSSCFKCLHT